MSDGLRLTNRHTGETLSLRRTRDPQGQMIMLMEGSLPPGKSGPPAHVHLFENESGRVQSGTLGTRVGGKETVVPAGGSAVLPAGVVHTWWNAGQDVLEFSGQASPVVDLDRYLQAVFAVFNASASGRPSIFYMAHVLWRHRHTQVVAAVPQALQRLVLPVVLLAGHLLGKYRGDNWPGSPASCPGAPYVILADAHGADHREATIVNPIAAPAGI
jgi:quercetin dioxygenase-like cupin family protein